MRECHQHDFFDQRRAQCADGLLDQLRPVVERHDAHAGRKPWCNLLEPGFHRVDHGFRVDTRARNDHSTHRLMAIAVERAYAERIPNLHRSHVSHVNGRAIRGADHNVFYI